jgi:hypothetical protein
VERRGAKMFYSVHVEKTVDFVMNLFPLKHRRTIFTETFCQGWRGEERIVTLG